MPPSGGWKVRSSGVRLKLRSPRSFAARLRGMARRTGYSEFELASLLRCLPEQTLSEASEEPTIEKAFADEPPHRQPSQDFTSNCSFSTYVFGASEVGSGPVREMLSPRVSPTPSDSSIVAPPFSVRSRSPSLASNDPSRGNGQPVRGSIHSGGSSGSRSNRNSQASSGNQSSRSNLQATRASTHSGGSNNSPFSNPQDAAEGSQSSQERPTKSAKFLRLPVPLRGGRGANACKVSPLSIEEDADSSAAGEQDVPGGGAASHSSAAFSPVSFSTLLQRRNRTPTAIASHFTKPVLALMPHQTSGPGSPTTAHNPSPLAEAG